MIVAGDRYRVSRRRGSDDSPIVALKGVTTREAAVALGGELLLVTESNSPLEAGEWLAADLIGCRVEGARHRRARDRVAVVRRARARATARSIPLIADAVTAVDTDARTLEVDRAFLGLEPPPSS